MKEKLRSTINKVLPPFAALLLIFLAWYCICAFGNVPKYMLPSPGDVLAAFQKDWQLMLSHARVTLAEAFMG